MAFEAKFGVFPTMITPFNADDTIDHGAVRAIVDWYWQNGVDGIFAVCQSSEMHFMTIEEKTKLARTVCDEAARLARADSSRERMQVVVSGHTVSDFEEQVRDMNEMAQTGADGLVLVSNRMDIAQEGEDAWMAETERLMARLPEDMPLGMYECPNPYKRLMTEKMLAFCGESGRFYFMKDTCCDAALIARRVKLLEHTPFRLLNANGQTLLDSLRAGAHGYSGIMANFFPDLIAWLCHHFREQPEKADVVQAFMGTAAFTEHPAMPYPVTAKQHMRAFAGIPMDLHTRTRPASELTEYNCSCVAQMKLLADAVRGLVKA